MDNFKVVVRKDVGIFFRIGISRFIKIIIPTLFLYKNALRMWVAG